MIKLLDEKELDKFFNKSEMLIVAVSSGIDSMCLFHYLHENGYKLVLAHVNHKKRKESDREYEYLEEYSKKIGVPFEGYILPKIEKGNFQEEARRLRYDFLFSVARKYNTDKVLTAHQADDALETILMRLTRGTSIKGYSGINKVSTVQGIKIVRPMLNVKREDIALYQKENNITYFEDQSNSKDDYTRNKIRHKVIPVLKEINPNIYSSFNNYSEDLKGLYELLQKRATDFLNSAIRRKDGLEIKFLKSDFDLLEDIVKYQVIVSSVNYISNNTLEITHQKIKEIANFRQNSSESKIIELGQDYYLSFEYSKMAFYKENNGCSINLNIYGEGSYDLGDGLRLVLSQKHHLLPSKISYLLCYNNTDNIYPICVRNVMSGDTITVNNIKKKVFDLLIEHKVPKRNRKDVLVVLVKDEIVFVPNIIRKETDLKRENKIYITIEGLSDENR